MPGMAPVRSSLTMYSSLRLDFSFSLLVRPTIFILASLSGTERCIEARDKKDGWTPLMWAAKSNSNPEVIEALLKAGANPKAKDKYWNTAVGHAKNNVSGF